MLSALDALGGFAEAHAAEPCLAYTHFQPAQLTTVGKRATLWMQDLGADVEDLCHRIETMRLRGCKGTTGTQASFLELFDGDHAKVRELDRLVAEAPRIRAHVGGDRPDLHAEGRQHRPRRALAVSRSRPPRWPATSGCCSTRASCWSRSSPSRSVPAPWPTSGTRCAPSGSAASPGSSCRSRPTRRRRRRRQWLERTLDDSANRRLTLPEAFLATDAILILVANIAGGLEVRPEVIGRHVATQMPFMATERWLMLGVAAGGDRQALHEVVRRHSMAVAAEVAKGEPNQLMDRLAADPAFAKIPATALKAELEPSRYTGRAREQVTEFLEEYAEPLAARARPLAVTPETAEVRV